MKDIFNKISSKADKVIKKTEESIKSVGTEAERILDDPKGTMRSIEESAKSAIKDGGDSLNSLGKELKRMASDPEQAAKSVGKGAEKAAKDFGKGVERTTSDIADGARGLLLDKEDVTFYQRALYYQGSYIENLIRTRPVFDTILVMGESMTQFLTTGIHDPQIIQAYELAYPNLAAEVSLEQRVSELSEEQLVGLVSGIKGKLFEIQYVDLLNSSLLPEGATASLAENANQSGWDIQIHDANGVQLELLQAKATSSVGYVQQALDKYPNIDVVTTEETFEQLVQMGNAEGVVNSGVSNSDLQANVEDILGSADGFGIQGLPAITLALVAFTSYNNMGCFDVEDFTYRGCQAYIAYLVSLGAMSATGVWLMGPLASIVSMGVMHKYTEKYRNVERMRAQFEKNEAYIKRVEAN